MVTYLGFLAIFCAGAFAGAISERHIWLMWFRKNYPEIYHENGGPGGQK